jgi:FlaA1/EpsC-like NDP-sugar epimerase
LVLEQFTAALKEATDERLTSELRDKSVLITGGTGVIGVPLVQRILNYGPKSIHVVHYNHAAEEAAWPALKGDVTRVTFDRGNLSNEPFVKSVIENRDTVFHRAGLSRSLECEGDALRASRSNVCIPIVLMDALDSLGHCKRAVFLSSVHAASASNVYGMTKSLMEGAVRAHPGNKTQFIGVRLGLVLGETSGGVLAAWKKAVTALTPPQIFADKDTIRLIQPLHNALEMILYALVLGDANEIVVPDLPATTLESLARAFTRGYRRVNPKDAYHKERIEPGEGREHGDPWTVGKSSGHDDLHQIPLSSNELRRAKSRNLGGTQVYHIGNKDKATGNAPIPPQPIDDQAMFELLRESGLYQSPQLPQDNGIGC